MTSVDAMAEALASDDISHLYVEVPDVDGVSRSKLVDADYARSHLDDGISMNVFILGVSSMTDVPEGTGWGEEIDFADGTVYPDPSTFSVLPWRDDTARVIADFEFRGEPVPVYTRNVLKRVLADANETLDVAWGVGNELEFFLLDEVEGEYRPVTDHPHEYVTRQTERVQPFYDRVKRWNDALGTPVTSIQHEYGNGMFEVLFEHGPPLEAADRAFTFREVVKQAAIAEDRKATFMAKPFTDASASGYHLHLSAFDGEENVFADGDELSDLGRAFVGGLIEHADALVALGAPNINGYKRFTPGSFSPYTVSWAYNNRTASIRVPEAKPVRIENRIAGADANPYVVLAATLAAGLHGVREGLDPGEPVVGDAQDQRPPLPTSQEVALRALEADDVMVEALGEGFIQLYTAIKRHELAVFNGHVTGWERRYLEVL